MKRLSLLFAFILLTTAVSAQNTRKDRRQEQQLNKQLKRVKRTLLTEIGNARYMKNLDSIYYNLWRINSLCAGGMIVIENFPARNSKSIKSKYSNYDAYLSELKQILRHPKDPGILYHPMDSFHSKNSFYQVLYKIESATANWVRIVELSKEEINKMRVNMFLLEPDLKAVETIYTQ